MPPASQPVPEQATRVLFTDPGLDDALALALLGGLPDTPVDHIVATAGNVTLSQAAANLFMLAERFGLTARLCQGSHLPPDCRLRGAAHVHGADGLAGAAAPPRALALLPDLMEHLRAGSGPIDVLVLGPATDAARLLASEAGPRVRHVVMMGGAFEPRGGRLGNVTPWAEFNVYVDPCAAHDLVRLAGSRLLAVPLDATEAHAFEPDELMPPDRGGPVPRLLARFVEFLADAEARMGHRRFVFAHDVIATAIWAGQIGFQVREVRLLSIPCSGPQRGRTLLAAPCDGLPLRHVVQFDAGAFLALWQRSVRAYCP